MCVSVCEAKLSCPFPVKATCNLYISPTQANNNNNNNNTCTHTTCDNHHYKYYHNYTTTDWATGSCSRPILIHLKLAYLIFDNFIKSSKFIFKTQKFDWVIHTKFRALKNVRLTCIVRYPIR